MDEIILCSIPLRDLKETFRECVREEMQKNKPEEKAEEELIKINEAVKILQVSKVTISKWMKQGIIPYHRISSRIYFKRNELIEAKYSNSFNKRRRK
jgi:hypothetical protein